MKTVQSKTVQWIKNLSWVSVWVGSIVLGLSSGAQCAESVYKPIPLVADRELKDALSDRDIPTGDGGFARDYLVTLQAGDQIAIDLVSDIFDPMVVLLTPAGNKLAENDDGPDGTPNALLFTRIVKSGNYLVRVKSFGETAGGAFRLTLNRLRKAN